MLKPLLVAVVLVLAVLAPAQAAKVNNGKVTIYNATTDDADVYVTNEDPESEFTEWPYLGYCRALKKFKVKRVPRFGFFSYGMDWDRDGVIDDYFTVDLNGTKSYSFTWTP